ncbi:unnamed protein product [Prorocentrum cordatum]|uniref:Uncharacterized protein n=1 Tax=Prorocentrum cordatum TaxID=2364126 RepID=A0ABN9T5V5_9DINO|nr:unnamed protein product [Polarella glacialis]
MSPARRAPPAPPRWLLGLLAAALRWVPAGGSRAGASAGARGRWRAAAAGAREETGAVTAGGPGGGVALAGLGALAHAEHAGRRGAQGEHGGSSAGQGDLRSRGGPGSHGGGQGERSDGELDSSEVPDGHGDHGSQETHGHGAAHEVPDGHGDHGSQVPDDHGDHGSHETHGHGAAQHHGADGGEHDHGPTGRGASSVAIGLVTTTIMIPVVLSMALSEGLLGILTMKLLDTFVSIFLAVLWFSAFNQTLITFGVASWFPFAKQVACLLQVMMLYIVAITVAWLWRDKHMQLTTFTVCGAHYIAFAGIGATNHVQESAVGDEWSVWSSLASLGFVIMTVGFLSAMYVLNWVFFRWKRVGDCAFQRSVDEMEVDIAGLVSSFLVTQAVQHAITGEYPHAHLFLQLIARQGIETTHLQRTAMLVWSTVLTFVAGLCLPMLEEYTIKKDDHWARRSHRFLKVFMVMMVAWGYLIWGTWQFQMYYSGDQMYGHMLFASLCTFVVLGLLYARRRICDPPRQSDKRYRTGDEQHHCQRSFSRGSVELGALLHAGLRRHWAPVQRGIPRPCA